MVGIIVGVVLVAVGVTLLLEALPFVHHVARLWPRSHTRSSADLLASSAFLNRFLGIVLTLAGLGMIIFELMPG